MVSMSALASSEEAVEGDVEIVVSDWEDSCSALLGFLHSPSVCSLRIAAPPTACDKRLQSLFSPEQPPHAIRNFHNDTPISGTIVPDPARGLLLLFRLSCLPHGLAQASHALLTSRCAGL